MSDYCHLKRNMYVDSGTSKGSFTPLLQLKTFPDIPVSTREEACSGILSEYETYWPAARLEKSGCQSREGRRMPPPQRRGAQQAAKATWSLGSIVSLSVSRPYSCLENPMDRGAWWARVHGVAKSRIRLSDYTYLLRLTQAVLLQHQQAL